MHYTTVCRGRRMRHNVENRREIRPLLCLLQGRRGRGSVGSEAVASLRRYSTDVSVAQWANASTEEGGHVGSRPLALIFLFGCVIGQVRKQYRARATRGIRAFRNLAEFPTFRYKSGMSPTDCIRTVPTPDSGRA